MERQVDVLRDRCEEIERADAQRRAEEEKKHAEDVSVANTTCAHAHAYTLLLLLIYAPIVPLLSPSPCLPSPQVAYLKNLNDTLKRSLETILAAPKK